MEIPAGIRTTLSVLADIHSELSASRTNKGQGSSEHAKAAVAPRPRPTTGDGGTRERRNPR